MDYGAGRYVGMNKAGCWIGLDSDCWRRFQVSPLWMKFYATDWGRADQVRVALESFEFAVPPRLFVNDSGNLFVPIFIRPGASEETVVKGIVEQIRDISEVLDRSSMTDFKVHLKKKPDPGIAS